MYHLESKENKDRDFIDSCRIERFTTRQIFGSIAGPAFFAVLLLLPDTFLDREARKVAAVAGLMAIWWICETIPLAATALVPVCAFPLLEIAPISKVASSYAGPEIFLFLGGFMIAAAMQRWNLHRRIALSIVCIVGCRGSRLLLGFMIATAAISLWVSNTATAMMMMPIAMAVLSTMQEHGADKTAGFEDFRTALLLGIAYAASIGGVGTLIGSPPNLIFAAQVRSLFPGSEPVSFVQWAAIGLPFVAMFLPLSWLCMTQIALRGSRSNFSGAKEALRSASKALGPMSRGELYVLAVFLAAVAGWVMRSDIEIGSFAIKGWESVAGLKGFVHDATIAVTAAIALFLIPLDFRKGIFLLDWTAVKDIPWGILVLFGGGMALGGAILESGLASRIASSMSSIEGAPLPLIIALSALSVSFLTEITSNTAIATIMLPVLGAGSIGMGIHPFALMIPAAISASCAFMMPVATPPNAIVYSSGMIPMTGMVRIGILMNIIGVAIVVLLMYIFAVPAFGEIFGGLPRWASP